jgi:glycosyltransferase involved in cell wall biosynthesis
MKILMVAPDLDRSRGGPAQACIEMARLMGLRGHQVRIVTSDRGLPVEYVGVDPGDVWRPGVAVEAFPVGRPRFWGTSWPMHRRLRTLLPDADIVHIHMLYLFHDWAAAALCRRLKRPYIVQPHGALDPFIWRRHRWRKAIIETAFQRADLRRATGLLYTSAEERDLARPYAHNRRGWVLPLGLDLAPFERLPPRSALRLRYPEIGDRKVVLFFGRLNYKKGIDTAIEAFASVARARRDVFLLIVGPDGGMRSAAERWVAAAGIGDRTRFTGMVSGEDKSVVLGGSDIFLLPSQSENFGIAVVEAAASGIPVVISDRVNLWRDFDDAQAGLVAPPTAPPFAAHIHRLLDRPAEASAIARRGVELVRRRFDWKALGPRYEDMYREAAAPSDETA